MLKSLELFGFKSFADRTVFEFSPGITCVVGPNGSGKSNVVDALKWILGDQSAKSLRGKEMSDVIFNGSSGRRSSGFAEATLAFDNSEGLLPIDAAEVRVGRRLYQSGDSEYLLNQNAVRLKDIRDLFVGTGAGTAAYSIIEQGRVDQILQANPTTRRIVFEEAAGISKFKSRRVDAERRLERVAQNLLRLTDIVDEVESQVTAARSQASKAARFRDLSEELKSLWTGLAADDFRLTTETLATKNDELENLLREIEECNSTIEELEERRTETDSQISDCDNNLISHERTIGDDREAIARAESIAVHQHSRIEELDERIEEARQKVCSMSRRRQELQAEAESTHRRYESFRTQLVEERQALQSAEESLAVIRNTLIESQTTIDELRSELSRVQSERSQKIERIAVLETQATETANNIAAVKSRQQRIASELSQATAKVDEEQKELSQRQAEVDSAKKDEQRYRDAIEKIKTDQKLVEQQIVELNKRRSGDAARLVVLEELEQQHAGISIDVSDILDRAQSSHYPPWNRVLGLVRDLIDVPFELGPIIEAALGERAQWIALSDLEPMIDYLNRGSAPIDGRIGFVSVGASETTSDDIDLSDETGVYGRADRLIEDRSRVTGLAGALLADTWIVESLVDAQRLMSQGYDSLRFVTLQGELVARNQELVVGQVPHESSIVSRKSEVRQLRNSVILCDRKIEDLTKRQQLLCDSLEASRNSLAESRSQLEDASTRVTASATRLSGVKEELARIEESKREIDEQIEEFTKRSEEITNEKTQRQTDIEELDQTIEKIQQDISSIGTKSKVLVTQQKAAQTEIDAQHLKIAKAEERFTSLESEANRANRELDQATQAFEEITQQIQKLSESKSDAELTVLNAGETIAVRSLALEKTVKETRHDFARRNELRELRKTLSANEESQHKARRKLLDQQREIEVSLQQFEHQLTSTADRIFEEYQTPLQQLVESGASAYRIYLTERYGEETARLALDIEPDDTEIVEEGNSESDDSEQNEIEGVAIPEYEDIREELEARVDRLRRKIKMIGHVNPDALDSLDELETRFETLSHQLADLQQAKSVLEEIIRTINKESQRIFFETFETIRVHFIELFRKLFGGGDADLVLEDPEDVLECGIDIVARPPGKELRSISLLSGGEKTMTAVALLFAMFKSKPSPYCILDEVDAALDEANVDRYVAVIKEFVSTTQFVVITHRKRTMTAANILYGVTMEQAGISKRISVNFEDVNDSGEINVAA